jgi:RNA polymerase sigma-70 factor (ECF subfamily)
MKPPDAKPGDDSHPTRSSLLRRVKDADDAPAWQEFNDFYGPLIFRFATRAGLTETEAQEVVQETLIAAARNLPEFRYDPKVCAFKTWLLNLSRWRVTEQLRKRLPAAPHALPSDDATARTSTLDRMPDPAEPELDQLWEKEWQQTLAQRAVQRVKKQVTARQWQLYDLYVLKEWPAREVARTLQVSVARVYLAKHRTGGLIKKEVQRLRKEMETQP